MESTLKLWQKFTEVEPKVEKTDSYLHQHTAHLPYKTTITINKQPDQPATFKLTARITGKQPINHLTDLIKLLDFYFAEDQQEDSIAHRIKLRYTKNGNLLVSIQITDSN